MKKIVRSSRSRSTSLRFITPIHTTILQTLALIYKHLFLYKHKFKYKYIFIDRDVRDLLFLLKCFWWFSRENWYSCVVVWGDWGSERRDRGEGEWILCVCMFWLSGLWFDLIWIWSNLIWIWCGFEVILVCVCLRIGVWFDVNWGDFGECDWLSRSGN